MDEFDSIIGDLKDEHEGGRVALVLLFDRVPGTTMFDIKELVRGTYEQTHALPSYQNLVVAAAIKEDAEEIEAIIQRQVEAGEKE